MTESNPTTPSFELPAKMSQPGPSVALISVGTELTTGQILNKNSQWISQRLKEFGVETQWHLSVPDDREQMLRAFEFASTTCPWIFITGGLGPTSDDFTREVVAQWLQQPLQWHEPSWISTRDRLLSRGVPARDSHKSQCYYPEGATVLRNDAGTAHGFLCQKNQLKVFVLPGPPKEIESIWKNSIHAWLVENTKDLDPQLTWSWDCLNVPESEVADVVETALKECQFSKAYRVHRPFVEFKMSFPKSKTTEALQWKEVLDQKLARWIPTSPIYLDYNATTPLDPRCLETMTPYFQKQFGNSISTHHVGVQASKAVEHARKQVAQLLNVLPEEIFFTSGATESNNWILRSLSKMNAAFFSSPTEHKSVLETLKFLEKQGSPLHLWSVEKTGLVPLSEMERTLKSWAESDSSQSMIPAISLMWVNNELGSIHPMEDIAEKIKTWHPQAFLHTDATQAVGKLPVDLQKTPVDALSFSAHKLYGPQGVGVLFLRQKWHSSLTPLLLGGGHERGLRSGTVHLPGVVGAGMACEIAREQLLKDHFHFHQLQTSFEKQLQEAFPSIEINGGNRRSPYVCNVSFLGFHVPTQLDPLCTSFGSACSSQGVSTSHVLKAIGKNNHQASKTLRFSWGRGTTVEDLQKALNFLKLHLRVDKSFKPN